VQDLERHLRARSYPLRANQTYTSVARQIHEFLKRHRTAGSPATPPRRPYPTASPSPGNKKRDSSQGNYGPSPEGVNVVAVPRHPKPEVLGSSSDGALLVSLDGLRGQFERVVLRWRPQPPAEGPGGELTVPGTTRTVSLPDLRPGTTYHVEVHGVRAGQASKSYAFITTTGSVGWGGATTHPLSSERHLPLEAAAMSFLPLPHCCADCHPHHTLLPSGPACLRLRIPHSIEHPQGSLEDTPLRSPGIIL
jgi:syndecan 4